MVRPPALNGMARRSLSARLPYELHLALRYLRVHRGRTFLSVITVISVAGVAVGTAALVIALALMSGFVEDVRSRIFRGGAHLTVVPAVSHREFDGAPDLIARTEQVNGVLAAAPILYAPAMLVRAGVDLPAFAEVHGVEPEKQARVTDVDPAADPYAALAERGTSGRAGIVLGRELARRLGAAVGDPVRLIVPHVTLSPWGPVPYSQVFEVVGTYASEHFDEDAQRAYVGIDDARRLLHAPGRSSWIEVRLRDWRRLQSSKATLRAALGAEWMVVDLIEQNRALIRALNTEKLLVVPGDRTDRRRRGPEHRIDADPDGLGQGQGDRHPVRDGRRTPRHRDGVRAAGADHRGRRDPARARLRNDRGAGGSITTT